MATDSDVMRRSRFWQKVRTVIVMTAAVIVAAIFVWEGIVAAGSPLPTPTKSLPEAALSITILVAREGLECILVLAVLATGLRDKNRKYWRPIEAGAGLGFLAVIITWFGAVTIVTDLSANYGALTIQAATGLLAVVVILVEIDWLVHGVYWSEWIKMHTKTKRSLISEASRMSKNSRRILIGLVLVGFDPVYREGFEVVIFLQRYYLEMGPLVVFYGVAGGLSLTLATGYLTFLGQRNLPYKKMLVVTGILLTCVVFVMVGEEVNEMQAAGWIATTNITWMQGTPAWAELWFSIYPNVQTVVAQVLAILSVAGTFFLVRLRIWNQIQKARKAGAEVAQHDVASPAHNTA